MTREDEDAIIRRLEAMYGEAEDNETKEALFYAIEALKGKRPHGEWKQVGEMTYKCTKCGWIKKTGLMPYCENCGSDNRPKEGEAE